MAEVSNAGYLEYYSNYCVDPSKDVMRIYIQIVVGILAVVLNVD
ncbi:hypothetical protein [Nostoc sp. ATCC 53789]